MENRRGHVNCVFGADLDKIEAAPSSGSIHTAADSNSLSGSQNLLTDPHTNFHFTNHNNNNTENQDEEDLSDAPNEKKKQMTTWAQNMSKLNKRKKMIQDKTIYWLPSKKSLAINGQLLASIDVGIDQLATEIEQHECLMQTSASGEHLRMDTIRALPHSLTAKRLLKDKLARTITRQSLSDGKGNFKLFKYRISILMYIFWNNVRNTLNSIELWYESLKEIEGHFGSGIGTYFRFLRWLFTLNMFLFTFTFSFISIPQIVYNNFQQPTEEENNQTFYYNDVNDLNQNTSDSTIQFVDILTAGGYLKSSLLFYGAYTNRSLSLGSSEHPYSIPKAYFMTIICLYISTFIIISTSMARSYRKSFIETSGGIRNMYAHKVFCSWDFSISNSKAAWLKHANIYNELKEILSEIHGCKRDAPKIWMFWIICSQIVAHFLVGGMLIGLGVGIWIILQHYGEGDEFQPWSKLYLPIAVNVTICVLQLFFTWISRMEDYRSARKSLHITLLRNFMLEAVIIGVLIIFWLTKDYAECWETSVGQEIYRLLLVDFFVSVFFLPLAQLIHVCCIRKFDPSINKPEFDISKRSLELIFSQTLLWVGLLFSPFLAIFVIMKMGITFYVQKLTLLYLCRAPTQLWRPAQTQTLYLVMIFLSLLGVILAHGYIMTQVPVSQKCGPFRGNDFMYQIFIDGVLDLKESHWIWRGIVTVARPAVIGGILLTMAVIVYYLRAKSKARQATVKLLKDMLFLETKDKEFLLQSIARLDKNWLFDNESLTEHSSGIDIRNENFAETSSTWKYEPKDKRRSRENSSIRCRQV